jgi:hypothetical protein
MEDHTLEFIDGKFIRDGKIVAPEFGNKEQVELLNNLNGIKEAVKRGEYDIPCWESGEEGKPYLIHFRCTCGRYTELHPEAIETEFESSIKLSLTHKCECGISWKAKSEEGFFFNFKVDKSAQNRNQS